MDDPPPDLFGSFDLAYEIPPEHLGYYTNGAERDWLPISTMPRELRALGWVYLQIDRRVVARCRVTGIGFRERRWRHEPNETAADDGPGPTLELEGDRWERVACELGPDGDRPVTGYRYLRTAPDDSVTVVTGEDELV